MTISHLNPFIVKVCQCTIVDVRHTVTSPAASEEWRRAQV